MARKKARKVGVQSLRRSKEAEDKNFGRFRRACDFWDTGQHRRAFRLFLLGAKAGDTSSRLNLGFFYDEGIGVVANAGKALQWYRRAYRDGNSSAALNIGLTYRSQGSLSEAAIWFARALKMGDLDAGLRLAEFHLASGRYRDARKLITRALRSQEAHSEARRLLRRIERAAIRDKRR